jgi:hypothetical protein
MVDDIGQYIEAVTVSAMAAQSPLSIALSSDATVLMPSNDEEGALHVDSTVLMPHVDLTVEDNPCMQVESIIGRRRMPYSH